MKKLGHLYIVSAPSGAGKTSLVNAVIAKDKNICVSVSHTTRPMREGEVEGVNYYFVSKEQFEQMIAENTFIEYAQVFSHYYGTSKLAIAEQLALGQDVILEIDWQGARQIKELYPDATGIFILPPSLDVLNQRLKARGQDSEQVINQRMAQAVSEMSHYDEYEYIIINDNFDLASQALLSIFYSRRLLTHVQMTRNSTLLKNLLV